MVFGTGKQVLLRAPEAADCHAFLQQVERSYRLHHPWVAPPETPQDFSKYLLRVAEDRHCGGLVCTLDGSEIAGVINLSEIVRGAFGSAYLGYYAMHGCEERGLMREGLTLMIEHAFSSLDLHRLEANVQPENQRSRQLVEQLGFSHEGFSPRYLKINGDWRDHERYALLREEWRGQWQRDG